MNKVGVYDLKDKLITELSGGQLQRVFWLGYLLRSRYNSVR